MKSSMKEYLQLLQRLVRTASLSGQEADTACLLQDFLGQKGLASRRIGNNVIAQSPVWKESRPTLLLCSHHDTVPPASGYTRDPFDGACEAGRIRGLGSNDAGGSIVALTAAFCHFCQKGNDPPLNLLLDLGAEEENSGAGGFRAVLPQLPPIACALIGEPTGMQAATAERGLLVLDGCARGKAGHAARREGDNALYIALDDIARLRSFRFDKTSAGMGLPSVEVTQIRAGQAHNVIPDVCTFVVDVRPTDCYTNAEILQLLQDSVRSTLKARSLAHHSSATPEGHPLIRTAEALGIERYVSPCTSDWMHIPFAALKMGPGRSERSHTADEFIFIREIEQAVVTYIDFINTLSIEYYADTLG